MTIQLVTYSHGTTVGDLITMTEDHLGGAQRAGLNMLDAAIDADDVTVPLADSLDGIRPGAYIEIDDEVMYVRSVSAPNATVRRAQLGTTAAAHADESTVRVSPRFRRDQIRKNLRAEIESWPFSVYARYVGDLTASLGSRGVDMSGLAGIDGAQLVAAQRGPFGDEAVWATVPGARLVRSQDLTGFPSGYALVFPDYGASRGGAWRDPYDGAVLTVGSSFSLRVRVKARFNTSTFASSTDVGMVLGMPYALAAIAPVGAAARLTAFTDIARTDTTAMGRSRPAEEVRAGDATSVSRALMDMRDRLLAEVAKSHFLSDEGWALYV